jgi:hypothetical protein
LEEKSTTNKSFIKKIYFSSLTKIVGFCNHNLYLLEVVKYLIYVQLVFFFKFSILMFTWITMDMFIYFPIFWIFPQFK